MRRQHWVEKSSLAGVRAFPVSDTSGFAGHNVPIATERSRGVPKAPILGDLHNVSSSLSFSGGTQRIQTRPARYQNSRRLGRRAQGKFTYGLEPEGFPLFANIRSNDGLGRITWCSIASAMRDGCFGSQRAEGFPALCTPRARHNLNVRRLAQRAMTGVLYLLYAVVGSD